MPDILVRDRVWVSVTYTDPPERWRGEVMVVKKDGSECVVVLENGVYIRTPTTLLELRESHE